MASGVTAQEAVEVGGPEFRGVADGEPALGRASQSEAELQVFLEPGVVAIESEA